MTWGERKRLSSWAIWAMASRWSKTHRVFAPHAVEDVDLAPSSPLAIWGLFQGKTRGDIHVFFHPKSSNINMILIDVIQSLPWFSWTFCFQ